MWACLPPEFTLEAADFSKNFQVFMKTTVKKLKFLNVYSLRQKHFIDCFFVLSVVFANSAFESNLIDILIKLLFDRIVSPYGNDANVRTIKFEQTYLNCKKIYFGHIMYMQIVVPNQEKYIYSCSAITIFKAWFPLVT